MRGSTKIMEIFAFNFFCKYCYWISRKSNWKTIKKQKNGNFCFSSNLQMYSTRGSRTLINFNTVMYWYIDIDVLMGPCFIIFIEFGTNDFKGRTLSVPYLFNEEKFCMTNHNQGWILDDTKNDVYPGIPIVTDIKGCL